MHVIMNIIYALIWRKIGNVRHILLKVFRVGCKKVLSQRFRLWMYGEKCSQHKTLFIL